MSGGIKLSGLGMRLPSSVDLPLLPPFRVSPRFFFPKRSMSTNACSVPNPSKKKEKVIMVSSPTGAGKSRLALELEKRLGGEIISAYSAQVYHGLDIGSAKPSSSNRKHVAHNLLDVLHPSEEDSAGQFFEDAREATQDVLQKGRVPIVAGGTGVYLRWYIYGKPDVPKASEEITSEVCSELMELQKNGQWDATVEMVVNAGDPKARLVPDNDWYRLRQSLEIIRSRGSPPSAFHVSYDSFKEQAESGSSDTSADDIFDKSSIRGNPGKDLDYDFICMFLSSPRVDLYRSINLRCEEMLTDTKGLLSEASCFLI